MKNQKLTPQDAISEIIPCVCGKLNCDMGLLISKYPRKKIKIRIINKNKIGSVVVLKKELMQQLRKLK